MTSICGSDCCERCPRRAECGGCIECGGRPFGGSCAAAECVSRGGLAALEREKRALIEEINALGVPGLRVEDLNLLNGCYVNLEYALESGQRAKFLRDDRVYWGNQLAQPGGARFYGVVGDGRMLLVCACGADGSDPELIAYRRRG